MARGRDVVEAYIGAYNAADWDALVALVAADYVHRNNALAMSLEQFLRGAAWLRVAMPDFRIEVQDVVDAGDRVAVRFEGVGTHQGTLFGEEPTGHPVRIHGMTLYRLDGGLIAEDWEAIDEHDLRVQVGAAEPD